MKRSIPQKLKLCSTFLLSTCLALPCIAIQEVSPPDNNLHATSALTAPTKPTTPVRASSISSTIASKSPQAKLILLQTDHQTESSQVTKPNSRANNGNWATLSPLPGAQTQTSGKLTLLPMGSKTENRTTSDNLEIPHHVLYPTENKTPVSQVKATQRKPIVLQNTIANVREDKPKSGQLQIIKNATAPTQPQRAGSVTLQPIVLKSTTGQTQKTSTETGQLQIIQNRPKQVGHQPNVAHPTNHNENTSNHSIQPIILNGKKSNRIRTHRTTRSTQAGKLKLIRDESNSSANQATRTIPSATLEPIVLQSKSTQTPTGQTVGRNMAAGKLRVIQSNVDSTGPSKPKRVESITLEPIILKSGNAQTAQAPPAPMQKPELLKTPAAPRVVQNKPLAGSLQTEEAKPVTIDLVKAKPTVQSSHLPPKTTVKESLKQSPAETMKITQTAPAAAVESVKKRQPPIVQAKPHETKTPDMVSVAPTAKHTPNTEIVSNEPARLAVTENRSETAQPVKTDVSQQDIKSEIEPEAVAQREVAKVTPIATKHETDGLKIEADGLPTANEKAADLATSTDESEMELVATEQQTTPAETTAPVVSAAGIPFYPNQTSGIEPPKNDEFPRGKELEQVLSQNGNRGMFPPAPPVASANTKKSADLISASSDTWIQNRRPQDPQQPTPESVVEPAPEIAPSEISPGTGDYFLDENAVVDHGVNGCGNPSCIGCYGGNESAIVDQMGRCGSMLCARRYFIFDTVYTSRSDGGIVGSTAFSVGTDSKYGIRATMGIRRDAAVGTELSFFGVKSMTGFAQRDITIPGTPITPPPVGPALIGNFILSPDLSFFLPGGGYLGGQIQTQLMSTELQSLELNRTKWAWDVFKSFYGVRLTHFDDQYLLASQYNQLLGSSDVRFGLDAQNLLVGPQIGAEYFYDVGYRVSFSFLTKIGGHINFSELTTQLSEIEQGSTPSPVETTYINNVADKVKIAGTLDLGFQTHLQIAPQSRLRFGYNALFMWGVLTSEANFPYASRSPDGTINPFIPTLNPFTGTDPKTNGAAVIFQGINFGLEIYR